MRIARTAWIVVAAVVVSALMLTAARIGSAIVEADDRQDALQPFYESPASLPAPGTLIRSEPLGVEVEGGRAYRVLFSSERPDGSVAASSGMAFVPTTEAPTSGRPVFAFAHGTIGMGASCAPSRSTDPTSQFATWLPLAMARGWVVVAPDYTGLGTAGPNLYLVGEAEARDVVNAVRSAAELPGAETSDRWVVSGHSQGGHSALWTGLLAKTLAPELDLLGVSVIAPAAELTEIIGAQWAGRAGWVIGPEVVESWTVAYPGLSTEGLLDAVAAGDSAAIADECILWSALQSLVRERFQGAFFSTNPTKDPSWADIIEAQTPRPLPADMPVTMFQSTADTVVLAWPNALLQDKWCAAGSNLSATWVGNIGHGESGLVAGPEVIVWAQERFDGTPQVDGCAAKPAIAPIPPAAD